MRAHFIGATHLAATLMRAAGLRGHVVNGDAPEVVFVAVDVLEHNVESLARVHLCCDEAEKMKPQAVVIVSQVPPGFARSRVTTAASAGIKYYTQVDTIIMTRALERAYAPEQFIVGTREGAEEPLVLPYQEYLLSHGRERPVRQMTYESAEVAKLAINYMLMMQIETANILRDVALACGADYGDVRAAMHGDARIGARAYLRPGQINQHLERDVMAVRRLMPVKG